MVQPKLRKSGELVLRKMCRHCFWRKSGKCRGLCWTCYNTPVIREKYPARGRNGHRGSGMGKTPLKLGHPTAHAPGTAEKESILAARAAAGEILFHPLDFPFGVSLE